MSIFQQNLLSIIAAKSMCLPVRQVTNYFFSCICCQANMQPLETICCIHVGVKTCMHQAQFIF